ncbi:cytochrome P450 [Suillus variegatus]|nr:cytochrome P450 [Suillus variegatus]
MVLCRDWQSNGLSRTTRRSTLIFRVVTSVSHTMIGRLHRHSHRSDYSAQVFNLCLYECILAGATVIANHWAIANDPEVFPEPHRFNSQCWIDNAGRVRGDIRFFTYGFGRRVCPGQHVANRSVFVNTALILWAFCLSENPAAKIDTLAFSDTANIRAAPFEICFAKRIDENVIRELCAPSK